VGYRWLDREKIKPLFAFGHGLSYTTFRYGKAVADKSAITTDDVMTITLPIKNTGTRDGAEVVQLYISDKKASLPRPVKELKGFKKVFLKAGEEQTITFTIDHAALRFYDDAKGAWIAEPGEFEALLGSSSADIRSAVMFYLK
jgi:beta-glucosidase